MDNSVTNFNHKYIQILTELSEDQLILQRAYTMVLKFVPHRTRLQYTPEMVALYIDAVSEEILKQDVIRMYQELEVLVPPQRLRDTLDYVIARLTHPAVYKVLSKLVQDGQLDETSTFPIKDRLSAFKRFTLILLHHPRVTSDAKYDLEGDLYSKHPDDLEIALLTANYNPSALLDGPDEILANKAIMFIACCKLAGVMDVVAGSLRTDRRFVKAVVQRNPYAIEYCEAQFQNEFKTLAIDGIIADLRDDEDKDIHFLDDVPRFILEDESFILQAASVFDMKVEELLEEIDHINHWSSDEAEIISISSND